MWDNIKLLMDNVEDGSRISLLWHTKMTSICRIIIATITVQCTAARTQNYKPHFLTQQKIGKKNSALLFSFHTHIMEGTRVVIFERN